jgi:hypothetical protein
MNNCSDGTLNLACFTYIFAKLAGFSIIAMSFTLKVPQIFSIVYNKSARGISPVSIYSDLINVLTSFLYCYKYSIPISISGEYISLLAQNFLILLLSWYYGYDEKKATPLEKLNRVLILLVLFIVSYICMFVDIFPPLFWDIMAASNVPSVSLSRFAQIAILVRTKEVGSLSLISFILRTSKNAIKTVLLLIETNEYIMIFNQVYNGILGSIVIALIIYYSEEKPKETKETKDKKE